MSRKSSAQLLFPGLVLLAVFATPDTAHAYIDPGTGAFFLQMLLAAVIGAAVVIRTYWHKLKRILGFKKEAVAEGAEDESAKDSNEPKA